MARPPRLPIPARHRDAAPHALDRVHSRGLASQHAEATRTVSDAVSLVELTPIVLSRAFEPFPATVRTLDALHPATIEFLREQGRPVERASYDQRLLAAGRALEIPLRAL